MGYQLTEEPYTRKEIEQQLDRDGYITGIISVGLYDLLDINIDGLNELAEDKLVETGILSDIDYDVVGTGMGTTVHIRVTAVVDFMD